MCRKCPALQDRRTGRKTIECACVFEQRGDPVGHRGAHTPIGPTLKTHREDHAAVALTILMQLFSSKVLARSVTISWATISTACCSSPWRRTKSSLASTAAPAPSDVGLGQTGAWRVNRDWFLCLFFSLAYFFPTQAWCGVVWCGSVCVWLTSTVAA